MARAASDHLAYDAIRLVSLLFPCPNLPFHTIRNSVHCDIATVPSEGLRGRQKFVYRDTNPLSAALPMAINRENVDRILLAQDSIKLCTTANAVMIYRSHSHCQSFPLNSLRFTFMLPCIVIDLFLNNQTDAQIIQIYSVIKLYMFRASSLPIIRSFLLYIRHW